jgi:hypothetical protein
MKKVILTAAVALLVPVAALASGVNASDLSRAEQFCRGARAGMGVALFRVTYGTNANRSNAFGKCLSHQTPVERQNRVSSADQCNVEQSDVAFPVTHGGKTFAQFYGTGKHNRNAFRRCVSQKATATSNAQQEATVNAAKACKAERSDPNFAAAHDGKSFAQYYGTNHNHRNAFGKCVSQKARAK